MKFRFIILVFVFYFSCSKIEPRKPIKPKPSTTILKETIKESKILNKIEDDKILEIIKLDSINNYLVSSNGFWYTYVKKTAKKSLTPKTGDLVAIKYNVTDLQNNIIYSREKLGVKEYIVDKEDFISALQSGIKLMKVGETITFVIPSYNAFGISGDGDKIGINQSIKSTVTLININN